MKIIDNFIDDKSFKSLNDTLLEVDCTDQKVRLVINLTTQKNK